MNKMKQFLEGLLKALKPLLISGCEVLPLVEGGKGISVSNGETSGGWARPAGSARSPPSTPTASRTGHAASRRSITAAPGASGTRSWSPTRIAGALAQARRAYELAGGMGRIHANILWEMGAAERIITEDAGRRKGLINGITCGAGMPYRLSDIAARFNVYYYPIISSARAFSALWKRAYSKAASCSAAWSTRTPGSPAATTACPTARTRRKPEDPFPRVLALRKHDARVRPG